MFESKRRSSDGDATSTQSSDGRSRSSRDESAVKSSLVSDRNSINVDWFAKRGLMSKASYRIYKKEMKRNKSMTSESSGGTSKALNAAGGGHHRSHSGSSVESNYSEESNDDGIKSGGGGLSPREMKIMAQQKIEENKEAQIQPKIEVNRKTELQSSGSGSIASANQTDAHMISDLNINSCSNETIRMDTVDFSRRDSDVSALGMAGCSLRNLLTDLVSDSESDRENERSSETPVSRSNLQQLKAQQTGDGILSMPLRDRVKPRLDSVREFDCKEDSLCSEYLDESDEEDEIGSMKGFAVSRGLEREVSGLGMGGCGACSDTDEDNGMTRVSGGLNEVESKDVRIGGGLISTGETVEVSRGLERDVSVLGMGGCGASMKNILPDNQCSDTDEDNELQTAKMAGERSPSLGSCGQKNLCSQTTPETSSIKTAESEDIKSNDKSDTESIEREDSVSTDGFENFRQTSSIIMDNSKWQPSTLVARDCSIDPSWFASRGLMSKNSLRKHKEESRSNRDTYSTIATSLSLQNEDSSKKVEVSNVEVVPKLRRASTLLHPHGQSRHPMIKKKSHSLPPCRSVSLDDGIECVTELFVAALTSSSESEKRTAFAKLVLNENEIEVLNGIAKRLSAAHEENSDDEFFKHDEIKSSSSSPKIKRRASNAEKKDYMREAQETQGDNLEDVNTNNEEDEEADDARSLDIRDLCIPTRIVEESTKWRHVSELSDMNVSDLIDETNQKSDVQNDQSADPHQVMSAESRNRISDLSCIEESQSDYCDNMKQADDSSNEGVQTCSSIDRPTSQPEDLRQQLVKKDSASNTSIDHLSEDQRQRLLQIHISDDFSTPEESEQTAEELKNIETQDESSQQTFSEEESERTTGSILVHISDQTNLDDNMGSETLTKYCRLHSIPSGDESDDDVKETVTNNVFTSSNTQPSEGVGLQLDLSIKKSLLDEGMSYLSMAMLALLYRKLREMSLLGHVSVKLRDIDVNSYQAISRQRELRRRGLLTAAEESKGFLDRTKTAEFIIRSVMDECQMFEESNDLLALNPIDQVTADYDASILTEINTWVGKQNGDPFRKDSLMRSLIDDEIEVVWFSDRHPNDLIYGICVNRRTTTVTVVFRGLETAFARVKDSEMTNYPNPIADEDYQGNSPIIRLRAAVAEELLRVRRDTSQTAVEFIRDKVHAIGKELANGGAYHLSVTGHGLAGGYATLLGFYLATDHILDIASAVRVYTFASSRVGSSDFQRAFQHLEDQGLLLHARFTNQNDMISLRPFFDIKGSWRFKDWYKHVGMHINMQIPSRSNKHSFEIEHSKESTFSEEMFELLKSYVCGRVSCSQISDYHCRMIAARNIFNKYSPGGKNKKNITLDESYKVLDKFHVTGDSLNQSSMVVVTMVLFFAALQLAILFGIANGTFDLV